MNSDALRRPLLCGSLFALLLGLGACASQSREWREFESRDLHIGELWKNSEEAMTVGLGLRVDAAMTDRGHRRLVSQWRVQHHGFKPSERLRMRIELEPIEDSRTDFLVRYYAEREIVDDPARRLFPTEDDWSAGGQSGSLEQIFDYQLRSRIALSKGEELPSPTGTRASDPMDELIERK